MELEEPVLRTPRARRPGDGTPGLGPGFRRGLAASIVLHGALGAALLGLAAGAATKEPRPVVLTADFEATVALEPDPPLLEARPPDAAAEAPVAEESLLEAIEVPADPREDAPAAGGDAPAPRSPLPERWEGARGGPRRRGTGVAESATGTGGAAGTSDTPAPAPREGVFAPARRRPEDCPAPEYPAAERRRGVEGSLRLRLVVGEDGAVRSVEVAEPSGAEALDAAAVEAVRAWRFTPATEDGEVVESTVLLPVSFRLKPAR